MTEYDKMVQSARVPAEELPVLIGCLVQIANADGVFSEKERVFLSGIVEAFTDSPDLARTFLDSAVPFPGPVELGCPDTAILLSYMLAYTDGCFSDAEAQAISLLATQLSVADVRCSELHRSVKKKLYNTVLFSVYEDMQKTDAEEEYLDELRITLRLSIEDASEEEERVCKELKESTNA